MAQSAEQINKGRLVAVSLIRGVAGPGLNSSLGVFFPSVAVALGVSVGVLSWSVSVASLAGMLFLPLASRVFAWLGLRMTSLLGVLLVSLSFLAIGFASHLVWWYVLAVPFGIGTVLIVNLLGPLALDAHADDMGRALGWMMTLAGVAAIPILPSLNYLAARGGYRVGYLAGGAVAFAVMLPCACLLPARRSGEGGATRQEQAGARTDARTFFSLFLLMLVIVASNAFHQHFAVLGENLGLSDPSVSTALTLSMCGAALGGVVLGWFTHRFGGVAGGYLALGIAAVAMLLFLVGTTGVWFSVAGFAHGISSAAIGITVQTLVREHCARDYAATLARLLTAIPLGNIVATPLWGMSYDLTHSYALALWGILALLVIGAGCLFYLSKGKKTALSG